MRIIIEVNLGHRLIRRDRFIVTHGDRDWRLWEEKSEVKKVEKTPPLEGLIGEILNLLHSHKGKGNIHNTSHGSYLIG